MRMRLGSMLLRWGSPRLVLAALCSESILASDYSGVVRILPIKLKKILDIPHSLNINPWILR